jgi:tRNA(fMet)-specific endonuclease VapC
MYLFDTDILSNIVKRSPSAGLVKRLQRTPREMQNSSAINVGEIYYGATRSAHGEKIIRAFEEKVFSNLSILPFDQGTAKIFGKLKARLEKKGMVKSEPDLRIASVAIQHKLILVTGNTEHFDDIPGLEVENWLVD